jgi:hypothetical protein
MAVIIVIVIMLIIITPSVIMLSVFVLSVMARSSVIPLCCLKESKGTIFYLSQP